MRQGKIKVTGAREHNLKDVSLELPEGRLICFTGVSGSGKSSFAFDTLFAEGQRRYLESLSSYARQFLGQLAKPDVDKITGLSPAISIQQKTSGWNPRSTVGTITQIQDYLRVLFARVGKQHCTKCKAPIQAQSREQIVARIMELPAGAKLHVLAPIIRGQKGEYRDLFEELAKKGYARARIDGEVHALTEAPALARHVRHDIEVVVDRLTVSPNSRARIAEAVESALKVSAGTIIVNVVADAAPPRSSDAPRNSDQDDIESTRKKAAGNDLLLSADYACPKCNLSFEAPSPQLFSFNSPQGMCIACDGLGTSFDFDPELLVPNPKKTFFNLAVEPMRSRIGRWRRHIFRGVARHVGFDIELPWGKLPQKAKDALLYGLGNQHVMFEWKSAWGTWRHGDTFAGVISDLRDNHRKAQSPMVRAYYEKYMRKAVCPQCGGGRLNDQARAVQIGGKNINELGAMSVSDAREWCARLAVEQDDSAAKVTHKKFEGAGGRGIDAESAVDGAPRLSATEQLIARDVLREIVARLTFLCDVGLDYLRLDRTAPTLSGGESQRIRLASQIGAGLVGVLYILDEPSIGLHPRDNQRLLDSLVRLRDMGNTVIVVEHDEQTMRAADEIVDFGPGPGVKGGEVVGHGDLAAITKAPRSVTGKFLRGEESIEVPKVRRPIQTATASNSLTIEKNSSTKNTKRKNKTQMAQMGAD